MEDKLSMAHGLETRVPFMDNDLVDFAMKCPLKLKLNNLSRNIKLNENISGNKQNIFHNSSNDGKLILRKAMENYIPKKIVNAKKQGFSSPDASWFRHDSHNYVKNELLKKDSFLYDFLIMKLSIIFY